MGVTHVLRGHSHVGVTHALKGHSHVGVTHVWRERSHVWEILTLVEGTFMCDSYSHV